jgi:hypothetical protein
LHIGLAKKIYPDFATDEEDRRRRTKLMAEANKAFETGDEATLRNILAEWEDRSEATLAQDFPARLVRTQSRINILERRLQAIQQEILFIQSSDLYRLKDKVEKADSEGSDLLSEMAIAVDQEIELANDELEVMVIK